MPIFGLPAIFEDSYRDVTDDPRATLGETYWDNTDNVLLSYVKFSGDVTEGDVMMSKEHVYLKANISPKTNGGSDYPEAGSQTISEHDATYLTSLAGIPPDSSKRAYGEIAIIGGAGNGQRGYITHYTDKVLNIRWYDTDDGSLKTALGSDSDYIIYAPWYVEDAYSDASDATKGMANGIVLARSAKSGQHGFIGVEGEFPVKVHGTVGTRNLLIPGLVANKGQGVVAAAADVPRAFAEAKHAGATGTLVNCQVDCTRISIVREIGDGLIAGFGPPPAV